MKKLIFLFCLAGNVVLAQNLIPNSDFEGHSGCPVGNVTYGQLGLAVPWYNPTLNIGAHTGTSDYYNACATDSTFTVPAQNSGIFCFQSAHSGSAYAGIFLSYYLLPAYANFREYLAIQFTSPLLANACYSFEMYVNLKCYSKYSTDDIVVYFSDTLVTGIDTFLPMPYIPQITNMQGNYPDTVNWMLVTGTYMAHGGENSLNR